VEPEQGDVGRRRADRQCRDEGDAETGGDAAELAGPVGGDDVDLRLEAWREAGAEQGVLAGGRADDEGVLCQLGEADRAAPGQAVAAGIGLG
jgi:hypothetical protein